MNLRIHLPRLTALRADSVLPFELLDAQRRVQHRGAAVLAALPGDAPCELVLHPFDVLLLPVRLPKLAGAKLGAALPGIVEEHLAGDADLVHVVASARADDGTATAAVVERAPFARALEMFDRAGRTVAAATPAPLAMPCTPGRWTVRIDGDTGAVRTDTLAGTGFAAGRDAPVELRLLLAQADRPAAIDVVGPCDTAAWTASLGVPVFAAPAPESAPPVALDLLRYAFARRLGTGGAWRTTAVLGALLVATFVGGLQLHAWRLRAEANALRDGMARTVREVFPDVPVVLDAVVQMRRLVADLRPGSDGVGFTVLAQALGRAAGPDTVASIDYRDGVLHATFRWTPAERDVKRAALVARLAADGIVATGAGDALQLRRKDPP